MRTVCSRGKGLKSVRVCSAAEHTGQRLAFSSRRTAGAIAARSPPCFNGLYRLESEQAKSSSINPHQHMVYLLPAIRGIAPYLATQSGGPVTDSVHTRYRLFSSDGANLPSVTMNMLLDLLTQSDILYKPAPYPEKAFDGLPRFLAKTSVARHPRTLQMPTCCSCAAKTRPRHCFGKSPPHSYSSLPKKGAGH